MPERITLRQWTDVVRRARLGPTQKVVAMMLANYADADGSRVYPGIARLVFECELTYSTIKTALRELRRVGLIEKVGRRGDADEYRLILHEDLLERVTVPTPAAVNVELARIRERYRGAHRPHLQSGKQTAGIDKGKGLQSGKQTAGVPSAGVSAVGETDRTEESAVCYTDSLQSASQTATTHYRDTTTTTHSGEEVSTHVLVPGGPSADEDQVSSSADAVTSSTGPRVNNHGSSAAEVNFLAAEPRDVAEVIPMSRRVSCPHGKSARRNKDGQPRCDQCRIAETSVTTPPAEASVNRPELGPKKCPLHGLKGGNRPDGKPHCTLCRQLAAVNS